MNRVLVTGGAGFIGSHLVKALLARGCHVHVIDNLSTGLRENVPDGVEFHGRSAGVYHNVRLAIAECDTVFHLAATVGVKRVLEDPGKCLYNNIHSTEAVLEAANYESTRSKRQVRVILASSSEVYGNGIPPFAEDDPLTIGSSNHPRWSYAVSKLADEHLALWHCTPRYQTRTTVCRFFNTIGPGQRGDYGMVVPRFVRWALRGEPIQVYGDGTQRRCFCNVSDTVRALIALAGCADAVGEIVNVGSASEITMNGLAASVMAQCGMNPRGPTNYRWIPYADAYGPGFEDTPERIPDLTKIRKLIGWAPEKTLDETIRQVIAYERARL